MHHSLKLTTIAAVVFALTACVDSPSRLTSPDGPGFAKGDPAPTTISGVQQALYNDFEADFDALYACVTDAKLLSNKESDAAKTLDLANKQQWDVDPYGKASVEHMVVNKLIPDSYSLINAGKIPAECDAYTDPTALADEIASLLRAFWGSGSESEDGEVQATSCSADDDCEELNGNGWGVTIPAGTFNQDVIIIVLNNTAPFPDPNHNAVGTSKHFQVYPPTATVNEGMTWTRWLCWEGLAPGEAVDPANADYVIMVRADDLTGELEFLPTEEGTGDWCQAAPVDPLSSMSPLLRGARKLFAGSIFLPNTLHAYVPTKPFGGAGTIASPHWLLYIIPPDEPFTFGQLRALTIEYYQDETNAGAALVHLNAAEAALTTEQRNSKLDSYIKVVAAQTGDGKSLTSEQGGTLIGGARSLKQ